MTRTGDRHEFLAAFLAALVLAAIPEPALSSNAPGADRSSQAVDVQRIDSFLRDQVERHGIPGLAVGVVDAGRTIMAKGYGTADSTGRAVTAQTPFILASVSKPLTATAVMQLVDAGRVTLDAPVQRYLPQFHVADPDASREITVRDLLTHTSGLPASGCERDVGTLGEFVASLHDVTLDAPVGSRFIYCSGNYNILGLIVEEVSGEPFGEYVQRHIFTPLGMAHSYTSEAPARADGLAQGHRWIFGEVVAMDYYNASGVPSGYLISSAQDMCHFLSASMDGGRYGRTRLLSSGATAAMQRPQVDAGDGSTYGLGWRQGSLGGVPAVYHYGQNYNTETLAFMEPQTGRGAVILINAQSLLALNAFRSIENGVARLLDGQDPGNPAIPVPTMYVGFDTIVIVSSGLALLPLLRIRRWARRVAGPGRMRRRTVARVVAELAAPVLVLVAARIVIGMIGATWHEMFLLVPDGVGWLWGICGATFTAGIAHAVIAARVMTTRTRRSVSAQPTGRDTASDLSLRQA
jgi:CubicO group peptidase (beta-lactamase class C family)